MRDLKAQSQTKVKVKANRRKREKKPRNWKKFFHVLLTATVRLGSVVLLVSGAFLVGQMLFQSGYFNVERVRVSGQNKVSEEAILAQSDIALGTNIFDLDLEMIGSKIAENPWIASAQVERAFPREVLIRVSEHEPKAIVNLDHLYYVDAEGEVFKTLVPSDSLDYPVITGIDRKWLLERPEEARRMLGDALALALALSNRSRFNLAQVSELHVDATEGLVLYTLVGGIPVHMGFGNFDIKLDRLEHIYPELAPRLLGLKYIDLNVTDRVIVKLDPRMVSGKG
ncbi:cell division protein FtsQ [Desulfuromonas versatilis]|uniref:Cell division protein FtsQ n=1 Tax=Desulfuromonas versatilis TaxID=2802975 RepID=A0ABM8HQC0_9BACT|nr:FtsQ-type POTRA domain-containing protein [Desulfuromonas versatilis]BCR03966.1 cell division protein FtsQ [Desulfuromonas versatilis]